MKRKWKYLLGRFLLAAGLLAGCAEETGRPYQEIQAVESQEPELSEDGAWLGE